MPRRFLSVLLVPCLAAAGCGGGSVSSGGRALAAEPARPSAGASIAPTRSDVGPPVLTGELVALRAADIFVPRVPFWQVQVRWLEADGATVKKGQTLVELDSTVFSGQLDDKRLQAEQADDDLERQLADAQTVVAEKAFAVERNRAALEKARLDAAVPEELRSRREAQDKEIAKKRAETDLAKAEEDLAAARRTTAADVSVKRLQRDALRREIAEAEAAIRALSVKSPADGVFVVNENPRERRKIQVGDNVWVGLRLGQIPETSGFRVDAALYDVDDGRVRKGDRARVTLDADPERTLTGTVTDVAAIAQEVSKESLRRMLRLSVAVEGLDGTSFRPGQSVKIRVGDAAGGIDAAGRVVKPAPPADDAPAVAVRRADLVQTVDVTGVLRAVDSASIGPPALPDMWEFRIAKMAAEGKAVKKDEVVLAFDSTEQATRLEEKKAERDSAERTLEKRREELAIASREQTYALAEAKAKLEKSRLQAAVPALLAGANDVRKAAIDLALAEREVAFQETRAAAKKRAADAELGSLVKKLSRAAVRVKEIEDRIARLTIRAPREGTVLYLTNWRDEKKKVGDVAWQGEKILEIPDLSRLVVKADADEAELARIAAGQPAALALEARQDQTFRGRVLEIGRTIQRQTPRIPKKVVRLDISVDATDAGSMRPGMRVRGTIEAGRAPGVLLVPLAAVFPSPEGPVVFRKAWGGWKTVAVVLGKRGTTDVEVTKGLAEGDRVFAGGGAPATGPKA